MSISAIILSVILLLSQSLEAVTKGSETAVSVEPLYTFSGTGNEMLGFGWFKNGFMFQDSDTTASFNDVFPVSGIVDLNGGTLYLEQDLLFRNVTDLLGMGTICGYDHLLDLCSSITEMPPDAQKFSDINLSFDNDVIFNSVITFSGDCVINGKGNRLNLGEDGGILVTSGSSLELKNLHLLNVSDTNVACADCTSRLILNDMSWLQDEAFTFTQGAIHFVNEVEFKGTATFCYESPCTSIIEAHSRWSICDHLYLSIARTDSVEPLVLTDLTSALKLSDSTWHIRSSGMSLFKGTLEIWRDVTVDIDSTSTQNGLILGDGTSTGALCFELFPASTVYFPRGHVTYNVADDDWIVSRSTTARFIREAASNFYITQDLYLPYITMSSDPTAVLTVAPGKTLYYKDLIFEQQESEYQMEAVRYNWFTYLLNGNKYIFLRRGNFIACILVTGTGNKLQGGGTISGAISLLDSSAELLLDFNGVLDYDIQLNGGTLILGQDCSLMNGSMLVGGGTINLGSSALICGYSNEAEWTGDYTWQGISGCLVLNANMKLTGTWTFDGDCTIDGNNNSLDLSDGEIILAEDTTLCLKNIKITGVSGTNIRCVDNSGQIVMDDVAYWLDEGFTYTQGSFRVIDNVSFNGGSCAYQSNQVSSIAPYSSLTMSCIRFEVGTEGVETTANPFTFEDATSTMIMDNATMVVYAKGLEMTKGQILCERDVVLDIHSTSTEDGLFMGDGTPEGDLTIELAAGASMEIARGHVVYDITSGQGIRSQSKFSKMIRKANTTFYMKQNMLMSEIILEDSPEAWAIADPGVMLLYDNVTFICDNGETQSEYLASSYAYGTVQQLLAGNQFVLLSKRSLPIAIFIDGKNNRIFGDGGILEPITFLDNDAELYLGIGGQLSGGLTLNGGTLILESSLSGLDACGPGIIDISSYVLQLASFPLDWTENIVWKSDKGCLTLNSDVTLSSSWTFSGECVLNGNGHLLDLSDGSIVLEPNAHVIFKNINLNGVSGDALLCEDASCILELNNVTWIQDGDYTFSTGSLIIQETVKMKGNATFEYATDQESVISQDAALKLENGLTFSYKSTATDLLMFEDDSAVIELAGATLHTASQGLNLTTGRLFVKEHSHLSSTSTTTQDEYGDPLVVDEGITFGNGISDDDFNCEISSGVTLEINGVLKSKNVNLSSWIAPTTNSRLHVADNAKLYLYSNLDLGPGIVVFGKDTYLYRAADVSIISSVSIAGKFSYGFIVEV